MSSAEKLTLKDSSTPTVSVASSVVVSIAVTTTEFTVLRPATTGEDNLAAGFSLDRFLQGHFF